MTFPARIGQLTVLEEIGRGGGGAVFRGRTADGRPVAVKLAHRGHEARLAREAALLERIGPPAVPALIARGDQGGLPWLAMELIEGGSLEERMRGARPDLQEALAELARVAEAVEALHRAGVVHRDVKPSNILFRPDGRVALIDFGLGLGPGHGLEAPAGADARDARLTRTEERAGTVRYMAPEQWLAPAAIDRRTDVYALAVIAFELLSGRPPYDGDAAAVRRAHVSGRVPSLAEVAEVPAAVAEVVARGMAKEPSHRFDSAAELAAALLAAPRARPGERARTPEAATAAPAPTALVALTTGAPAPAVLEAIARAGAVFAGTHGGRYLIAFPAPSPAAGVRRAQRLAQELPDPRLVVHVADLRIRTGRRGSLVTGAALGEPETWLAGAPADTRLHLTEAAAAVAEPAPALGAAGLGPIDTAQLPLRGREDCLQALARALEEARAAHRPHLALVTGPAGAGKTRLIEALAQLLRRRALPVAYVRADGNDGRGPDGDVRELLRLATDDRSAGADAITARARAAGCDDAALAAIAAAFAPAHAAPAHPSVRLSLARALAALLGQGTPRVLLLDDGDAADPVILDALELATLPEHPPLLVVVAGAPHLRSARPDLGRRAASSTHHQLAPLSAADERALLTDLLHPVQFVPAEVADRLRDIAGGNPGLLVDLVQAVRASGGIRRDRAGAGFRLIVDGLLDRGAPVADRLVEQLLPAVPPSVVPLLELAALCPEGIDAALVRGVQLGLALAGREDDALRSLDAGAALERLAHLGLLRRQAEHWSLRSPLLAEGLQRRIPADRQRALHQLVLAHLDACGDADHHRAAVHAAGAGDLRRAQRAYIELGDRALGQHRYVQAEADYSAALDVGDAGPDAAGVDLRRRALAGRGRVRYRLQRLDEARDDLRAARDLYADEAPHAVAELLLEEATVLDWAQDFPAAEAVAAAARPLLGDDAPAQLRARADLASGRAAYRREDTAAAIELLAAAADGAAASGDPETRVIALLLLAPALVYAGELAEAERRFDEVIDLCRLISDDFHLAGAHINRQVLWMKREAIDRAVADLEACRAIAHELGNAQLERCAVFNLGELLSWAGDFERAVEHAQRSRALQLAFFRDYGFHDDALLLARIAVARGDLEAREHLAWIDRHCQLDQAPPSARCLLEMCRLAAAALTTGATDTARWEAVAAEATSAALLEERVEVLAVAAVTFARLGSEETRAAARRWLARATEAAGGARLWERRLASVAALLQ